MKRILVLIICFMFVGVVNSFAEPLPNQTWKLGTEISHITYKEPDMMKDEGFMFGFLGSYAYHKNFIMLKVEGRGSLGRVDYENSGTIDDILDYMLELRGLGGYDFSILKASTLTPYIGIGYRYLNDDSSGKISSTGVVGYERESNYLYSPIGVETITNLENGWSFGITVEYDIFWWGKQISHLSDVDPGSNNLENRQKKGYGIRGSIEFQKKGTNFAIAPFIRYWNIEKSEDADLTYYGTVIGYGYEPENNSTEYGVRLTLKF